MAFIEVKRSPLAQAFTTCLLIIGWAVYFRKEKPSDAILLFPLAVVVTIPTLRGLYVGLPPFGIFIGVSQALGGSWFKD